MAEAEAIDERQPVAPRQRGAVRHALRWVGYVLAAIVALLLALVVFLHTPPGRQFILDQISKVAPASGLSVEVGSIEGSVLWSATFHDVRLRDANDTLFFAAPEVDLNWRPHRWLFSGLDIRHLIVADATLYAVPELNPGDPDAPILPDFDIRVDRLVIDDLRVVEGILGEERMIDFRAEADIRDGRVFLDAAGEFGGGDEFALLADVQPDGNVFNLELTWQAPAGGFLAAMVGAEEDLSIRLEGDGTWSSWSGDLLAVQGGENLLDFDIYNEAGQYRLVGELRPSDYVEGMAAEALGEVVALTAAGTLEDSVLEGGFALRANALALDGEGIIDLADNRFEQLSLQAELLDSTFFGEGIELTGAEMVAVLDGTFRDLRVQHRVAVERLDAGGTILTDLLQEGTALYDGSRVILPLSLSIGRVISGNELVDPRLVNGRVDGTLIYTGQQLLADDLAVRFRGLAAQLSLDGDLDSGRFQLAGPVRAADLTLENLGTIDGEARIRLGIGGDSPWTLTAQVDGSFDEVTNSTLANLAGENIRFGGQIALGETSPIDFTDFRIEASKLQLQLDGTVEDGETTLTGSGTHVDYGPFTVVATIGADGPQAELVFANPLPAAGLTDVRVSLTPTSEGFQIETSGGSLLGPFDGLADLVIAPNGDTTISLDRLTVAETLITGDLALVEGGMEGVLDLSRGGVDGTIRLSPRAAGQGFAVDLEARNARFGGETPLTIASADIDASGVIGGENTTVEGTIRAQGIGYGSLFLGRLAVDAQVTNGVGSLDAALTGRRGSRFELLLNGRITPERILLAADGSYAGREISMPRRAVLLKTQDGGWELQRTQIGYGGGFAILRGRFGGTEPMQGRMSLSELPLSLVEVVMPDLGLGGTISGVIDIASQNGLPTGEARVIVEDLTRSGLLLTSRPMDLAAVIRLSPTLLQARAVMEDEAGANGRLAARIANLPQTGGLNERLYRGDLFAQLRYDGPAEALWRLAAIDLIDITGEMQLAANVRGTLGDPRVRGSLSGDDLTVQSALTGTVIDDVEARGRFDGSRLQLTRFAGTAPDGGQVSGSGFVDLSGMTAERGPEIDIRLAARNARILDLPGMSATVTGPMRIVSSGIGGTIAGRLQVDAAQWSLASADELAELPDIAITEINLPADVASLAREGQPWRYLIDAEADGGIEVDGMGLESEWRGNVLLRGTTAEPRIGGEARIVPRQGFYSFAGVRFEITRGRIDFDEQTPPDPRIDLVAETDVNGINVAVSVEGAASQPDITFSSVPALPEEELLARLLFGGSITDLSATDALQLGAALASLRGGTGVGPINQLRDAIGLDRLRIVGPDPALDRGTAVALGKNISRNLYAEIITDGQSYNVTRLEYRVTSWLSLLASISTIGRYSAAAEYSRDY